MVTKKQNTNTSFSAFFENVFQKIGITLKKIRKK